ncbi:MAG: hypothetical protein IID39_03730 [Planctomycetes bacterium]|nr:hypothetical protein [Planctomycetota bacterium]
MGALGGVKARSTKKGREPCKVPAGTSKSKYRRRRGNLGFDYRQACAVLRPELLAKLPERGRDEEALFDLDHVSYTP